MVDASTQYSPPAQAGAPVTSSRTPVSIVADLQLSESRQLHNLAQGNAGIPNAQGTQVSAHMPIPEAHAVNDGVAPTGAKRGTSDLANAAASESKIGLVGKPDVEESPLSKRQRPAAPAVRLMPMQYETCDPRDLVILISSMLMELVRYNDSIPLRDGHLTRFHSRAPPGISVLDYLQRLTTHATLSPPILLSMVYYIDKLCALYPAFTISSLTVHRFLITSATVASKGLSDSFWTNKTYARVGGVSMKELALLELEFLWRVEWRIVPKPEVLVDYYRSLVERSDGYEIDITGRLEEEAESKSLRDKG
jgi:Cyclin